MLFTQLVGLSNGLVYRIGIVAIRHANHIPAVSLKAFTGIVGKPVFNIAVNRNAVVVIQYDQL